MYSIIREDNPKIDDIIAVRRGIIEFNDNALQFKSKSVSIFLRDDQGIINGGVLTWIDADSIYIEIIWVDEKLRGQGFGRKLLAQAEIEGRKEGCQFSTLDTFEFQAEAFYLKNGYERLGEIKNYIRKYSRIFLRKVL